MSLFNTNSQMRRTMAYTNKVGDKVYPVVVDIKKGIKSTEEIQFVSSDVNTGILSVAFIQGNDNYNVVGADVVCSVMRPDASTLELPCEVVGENIVEVPLGINGTSQDGVYSFDFKVFKGGNKIVGTPIMNYSVSLSIGNDMVVEEDDRLPVLTVLMTQLTELKKETREAINQANVATASSREATANAIAATSNANTVSERVSQETATAITRVDNTIVGLNNTVSEKISEIEVAKSDMTTTVSNKVNEVETRFNALTSKQQQDAEVIDARDGETSLKARLDRDIEKAKQVYVNVEGSNISTDSSSGYAKDVEILGNTIQDASNLADIRSVGDKIEGQELYEIPVLSCGKNGVEYVEVGDILTTNGTDLNSNSVSRTSYIPVKSDVSYVFSDNNINGSEWYAIFYYDVNKQFIKYDHSTKFVSTINGYVRIKKHNPNQLEWKPQLEEGTVATPYEPYVEDKLTILSPVQLEKVGDVADRIIKKDGVWGVEKNIGNVYPSKSSRFHISTQGLINTYRVRLSPEIMWKPTTTYGEGVTMSNFSPFIAGRYYDNDAEHYYIENEGRYFVFINKDKFDGTVEGVANYFANNPDFFIKIQLAEPQFIPLPHSQQVKLRTFANKTNISFLTEIEGTIKAQVPKSLGATVNTHTEQINNLNKELDRVKKLEESTVSTVTTESDFTTVEATSNGYFEDVKLEGKTLVNLNQGQIKMSKGEISVVNVYPKGDYTDFEFVSGDWAGYNGVIDISNKKQITFICEGSGYSNDAHSFAIQLRDANNTTLRTIYVKRNGLNVTLIEPKPNEVAMVIDRPLENGKTVRWRKDIILEGDHTQNPPSYFEGLKSVGQSATTSEDGVDEIVVSSVKDVIQFEQGTLANANGEPVDNANRIRSVDFIDGKYFELGNVDLEKFNTIFMGYDENKKYLYSGSWGKTTKPPIEYPFVKVALKINDSTPITPDVLKSPIYVVNKNVDKKPLLYYNEETQSWEKPILREWDSIEKHADGKYYYHQRSGEGVFDGLEADIRVNADLGAVTRFFVAKRLPNCKGQTNGKQIFDRYKFDANFTGAYVHAYLDTDGNAMIFSECKTVEAFKSELQANNVTVVYQLAQEKVYECTNIDLITYANETNYIVESGAIAPKSVLKVHNNISNVVKILQEKVSLLESNVKASQEVQDMMILETDMRMLDIELALMEFVPMTLNLGGSSMLRSATYFNFVKNHIVNETYEKEYLENVMNKYLATGRINQDEYDELYKMLYPPVYDIELPIEL